MFIRAWHLFQEIGYAHVYVLLLTDVIAASSDLLNPHSHSTSGDSTDNNMSSIASASWMKVTSTLCTYIKLYAGLLHMYVHVAHCNVIVHMLCAFYESTPECAAQSRNSQYL